MPPAEERVRKCAHALSLTCHGRQRIRRSPQDSAWWQHWDIIGNQLRMCDSVDDVDGHMEELLGYVSVNSTCRFFLRWCDQRSTRSLTAPFIAPILQCALDENFYSWLQKLAFACGLALSCSGVNQFTTYAASSPGSDARDHVLLPEFDNGSLIPITSSSLHYLPSLSSPSSFPSLFLPSLRNPRVYTTQKNYGNSKRSRVSLCPPKKVIVNKLSLYKKTHCTNLLGNWTNTYILICHNA